MGVSHERCTEVIREICPFNYIDIISGNVNIHMLISTPPLLSVLKNCAIYKKVEENYNMNSEN